MDYSNVSRVSTYRHPKIKIIMRMQIWIVLTWIISSFSNITNGDVNFKNKPVT